MLAIAGVLVRVGVVLAVAVGRAPPSHLSNETIATALGRLVRDGAVTVEAGFVSTAGGDSRGPRDGAEARTLAVVLANGTIRVERLFAVMREQRG